MASRDPSKRVSRGRRVPAVVILAGISVIAIGLVGGAPVLEVGLALVFGWWNYLARTVPRVRVSPSGVVTAIVCASVFTAGLHRMLGWLRRESRPDAAPWRIRSTCIVVALVVVVFAAGIGFVGIAHQAGWLIVSNRSFVRSRPKTTDGALESNLKQVALGLHDFAASHEDVLPYSGAEPDEPARSWQTLVLPYLNIQAAAIDEKSAWDDPCNAAVFRGVVPCYLDPKVSMLRDARGYALSHIAGNRHVFTARKPVHLADALAGASQTLMAGEVATGFKPWGDPTNVRDPVRPFDDSAASFGSPDGAEVSVLMMDGSVKTYYSRPDPRVLQALAGPPDR